MPAKKKKTAKAKKAAPARKKGRAVPATRNAAIDRQVAEIRKAVEELAQEFRVFRDSVGRSSKSLLQGVMGFREALNGFNPLGPNSLREAGRRLSDGVQRFVRSLQGRL